MNQERRKASRFSVSQFVDVSFGHEQFYNATGVNISESGMLCEVADGDIGHSRDVFILLELPDGDTIDLTGMVVRIDSQKGQTMDAVEFTELFAEDKKKIKKFIESLESAQSKK